MKKRLPLWILTAVMLWLMMPLVCKAEIAGDNAFSDITWEQVYEENLQGSSGVLQSICATENYIICIENTSDATDEPDVISAYYRNNVDENGNPVEQYSLAKRVADTNWEHGNGMAYNPKTNEIYVSLYTSRQQENRGSLYVMDPDTLGFKRKIKISDDYNILGIGYLEEKDQYVIQTNVEGGYSLKILNSEFQLIDDLGEYANSGKGNNYQDLFVSGDYIINFPLTLGLGIGDFIHVFSISRKEMVSTAQLDFKFENVENDEPEGICELEPGVFLAVVNVTETDGSRKFRFYRTVVPYYFDVSVETENGTVQVVNEKVLRGGSFAINYQPEKGFELNQINVDGKDHQVDPEAVSYDLTDVQKNQVIRLAFTKIPINLALIIWCVCLVCVILMVFTGYLYLIHVKRVRKRKRAQARLARQRLIWQLEAEMSDGI